MGVTLLFPSSITQTMDQCRLVILVRGGRPPRSLVSYSGALLQVPGLGFCG